MNFQPLILSYGEGTMDEKNRRYKEEMIPNVVLPVLNRLNKELEGKEWFAASQVSFGL